MGEFAILRVKYSVFNFLFRHLGNIKEKKTITSQPILLFQHYQQNNKKRSESVDFTK